MYKHRVDYYDYTTVLYSIHTCNKLYIFVRRKSHVGRGVHMSGKQTSVKVHASGNVRRGMQDEHQKRGSRIGINVFDVDLFVLSFSECSQLTCGRNYPLWLRITLIQSHYFCISCI